MDKITTVRMRRNEPMHPGGPVTADVALSEVANWREHGWMECEAEQEAAPQSEAPLSGPEQDAAPVAQEKPRGRPGRKPKSV